MGTDSKALLAQGKALAATEPDSYDEAMLSSSERLAAKLKLALSERKMSQVAFADACGVSKQAVQGWLKTGRIDKSRLPVIAKVLGYPLEWWLADDAAPASITAPLLPTVQDIIRPYTATPWPFASISVAEYGNLSDRQKGMVEGYVRGLLSEPRSGKRNGTTDGH